MAVALCVGTAFSLRRAVFLIDPVQADRPIVQTTRTAATFLLKVIRANSISFSDDMNSRDWTSGYYMNNVRASIAELTGQEQPPFSVHDGMRLVWNHYHEILRDQVAGLRDAEL